MEKHLVLTWHVHHIRDIRSFGGWTSFVHGNHVQPPAAGSVGSAVLQLLLNVSTRVQKCADLNQMCTKNLSLLFAPSLFQTDGKGEHEVKIVEDLIDNYLYVFDVSTNLKEVESFCFVS